MNRRVQIKTVEAAQRNSQTQRWAAFQTLKRLLQIQLAIVCQMPQAHKLRSAQLHQLAIPQSQLTTKTAQSLRWMPVVLTRSEVVAKIKQKIALAAVYRAIKRTHPLMVHYAKVAIIIGGIERFSFQLHILFFLTNILILSSTHFIHKCTSIAVFQREKKKLPKFKCKLIRCFNTHIS